MFQTNRNYFRETDELERAECGWLLEWEPGIRNSFYSMICVYVMFSVGFLPYGKVKTIVLLGKCQLYLTFHPFFTFDIVLSSVYS